MKNICGFLRKFYSITRSSEELRKYQNKLFDGILVPFAPFSPIMLQDSQRQEAPQTWDPELGTQLQRGFSGPRPTGL